MFVTRNHTYTGPQINPSTIEKTVGVGSEANQAARSAQQPAAWRTKEEGPGCRSKQRIFSKPFDTQQIRGMLDSGQAFYWTLMNRREPMSLRRTAECHWLRDSLLFKKCEVFKEHVNVHKWYESEKAGRDIGWDRAAVTFMIRNSSGQAGNQPAC